MIKKRLETFPKESIVSALCDVAGFSPTDFDSKNKEQLIDWIESAQLYDDLTEHLN